MYDIIIKNGWVVDGSGASRYRADVGIKDGKIAHIGLLGDAECAQTIDARGMIVSPGFIDIHSHDDLYAIKEPYMEAKLRQGITTTVCGNCGNSLFPVDVDARRFLYDMMAIRAEAGEPEYGWENIDEYYAAVGEKGTALNVCSLIGISTVRAAVMGYDSRPPGKEELERMKALVQDGMQRGAIGLSFGLTYVPGCFCRKDELVETAAVAAKFGGIVTAHIRSGSRHFSESVTEMLTVAEQVDVPVHISHFKALGNQYLDRAIPMLRMLEEKRGQGLDITIDAYPYYAGSSNITGLMPPWSMEGGVDRLLERLSDPDTAGRIRADILAEDTGEGFERFWQLLGWDGLAVASAGRSENKVWEGMSFAAIGEKTVRHPVDVVLDLVRSENGNVTMITYEKESGNLEEIMRSDIHMFMTDGLPGGGKPHPRLYGSTARSLGLYSRDRGVISLEKAVSKWTGRPAARAGFYDRGLIRPGMAADVTIFDPAGIREKGTFADPNQSPEGIGQVIINGRIVLDGGKLTGQLPGKTLKRML